MRESLRPSGGQAGAPVAPRPVMGAQSGPNPSLWQPPSRFDEFHLLRPLGRGGMGLVYLARDTQLDRIVAIKFISAKSPDPRARQRFLIEARAVARLQHPNVVAVFRTGEVDSHPFLVSEYVRGRSLNLLRGPLPPAQVLKLGIGLARGLAVAHRQGVLHRDIKPANAILSEDGEVKLLDFGLAKLLTEVQPPQPRPSAPPRLTLDDDAPPPLPPGASALLAGHGVTLPGLVVGTPRYMAPELWSGETATRRSDVYSLGAILHELLTGAAPDVPQGEAAPLDSESDITAPSLRPRLAQAAASAAAPSALASGLAAIINRCLLLDVPGRYPDGEALREALENLASQDQPPQRLPPGNPYRGLLPFEAEHRALFCGRGSEARAVIERLRYECALVIVGDSGVGKSSLCRAAVLPALSSDESGALGAPGTSLSIVRMTPGRRPLRALAAALREARPNQRGVAHSDDYEADVATTLDADPPSLARLLREVRGAASGTLLFIDQLEELVTVADPHQAAIFAEALAELTLRAPDLRLLATARGDFLARLLVLPGLGDLLPRTLYLLHPLSEAQVRDAILGPAERTGLRFVPESLVDELAAEAVGTPGGLPLLQFALAELWEARDIASACITATALLAIGGIGGALARHAEAVLSAMPSAPREQVRPLLTRLVLPSGARARCLEAELPGDETSRVALAALIRGRLIVAREVAGEASYELAHEALIAGWTRLRDWLAADAELRELERRLHSAALEWHRLGRSPDGLWGPRQLAEADVLLPHDPPPSLDLEFLRASRGARRHKRLGRAVLLAVLPLLLLGSLLVTEELAARRVQRLVAQQQAIAHATLSEAHQQGSRAQALRSRAAPHLDPLAKDQPQSAQAARDYEAALGAESAAQNAFAQAARALEAAQVLAPRRRDVREALAQALYERVLLLDAFSRSELRDELSQRVLSLAAAGDVGKEAARRLSAPAEVAITSNPGARLRLSRYDRRDGRLVLRAARPLASGVPLLVSPGSYRVTAELAGHATTYLPLLLAAGDQRHLPLWLPPLDAVPAGFVYVPPGPFLYGSADDEELRRFLNAPPQHSATTAGFLIGQTEVRWRDWLVFLRALPRPERLRRSPRASASLSLSLSEGHDGLFTLNLQVGDHQAQAREGEPLPLRRQGGTVPVDWLELPVSGINLQDSAAYLRWLGDSGRVPGARLCSDAEWERAARGADGRPYPHGDQLTPSDAVYDETFGRASDAYGPDPVASHPVSVSPFGVHDLAGNVFEPVQGSSAVVYRGGSWYLSRLVARSNNRDPGDPVARDPQVGLRVCAPPPALSTTGGAAAPPLPR